MCVLTPLCQCRVRVLDSDRVPRARGQNLDHNAPFQPTMLRQERNIVSIYRSRQKGTLRVFSSGDSDSEPCARAGRVLGRACGQAWGHTVTLARCRPTSPEPGPASSRARPLAGSLPGLWTGLTRLQVLSADLARPVAGSAWPGPCCLRPEPGPAPACGRSRHASRGSRAGARGLGRVQPGAAVGPGPSRPGRHASRGGLKRGGSNSRSLQDHISK